MIRILEKAVSDKIAAGEVVERPLSIIKELLENSIDAGADSITVEIKNGGKSYIRVTDNGCGIEDGEALLAFNRYATSKIYTDSDLLHIETLGFRGEALASIAAVCRCELVTKTENNKAGTRVIIEGSELITHERTGCPGGTTIIVKDLYFNTPARYKFMKSDAAESGLIIDFISKMAIAYSNIKMRLISNGSVLFATQGKGDVLNNIKTVYGSETGKNLLPVRKESEDYSLFGFASPPGCNKSNKKLQIYFVNGRSITSKSMEKGVSGAYEGRLASGRYPVCFLFLKIKPEKLDVNIHPNKKEVRFDDDAGVMSFIEQAVKEALFSKEVIPEFKKDDIFKLKIEKRGEDKDDKVDVINLLSTMMGVEENYTGFVKEAPAAFEAKKINLGELNITGTVFSTYITAVDEDALYFIDQHAAHERIFYEKLMNQYKNEDKAQQILLSPFVIDVLFSTDSWLDALNNAAFDISEFGNKAYIIKAVPAFMDLGTAQDFIEKFLENVSETTDFKNTAEIERIMKEACKGAVKANERLAPEEIKELIKELDRCENPYNCPHGRPTLIKLTKYEIEKMFLRK